MPKEKIDYSKDFEDYVTKVENMEVDIDDNISYNLTDKIKDSYRLYNAMFANGSEQMVEDSGFKAGFIRKAWVVYRTLIQGSDVDLKNLDTKPLQLTKVRVVAFLRMLFISVLSRQQFGSKMDDILASMCWFGSAIVKRVGGKVELVDLRNYRTDPNEQDPQKRRHSEAHYYSYSEMEQFKEDWKDSWDEVEDLWEKMQKEKVSSFRVLEYSTWGKVHEGDKIEKICVKFLDNTIIDWEDAQKPDEWKAYVQLDSFVYPKVLDPYTNEEEPMFPYTQFDLFKVPGRFLSLGCGELLAVPSEIYNQVFNNKLKLDLKALMGLTVYTMNKDKEKQSITQEQLSQISTGTVFTVEQGESLTNLAVDAKSGEFKLMVDEIYELMRQIIGITAQGTGEEVPASTSATQAAINKQTADTVFDFVRERFHHGIDKLFNLGYATDIIDGLSQEDVVAITGDPTRLEQFDNFLIDNAINNWVIEKKEKEGAYPTEEEIFQEKQRLKNEVKELGDSRFPTIKKEVLKGLPYLVKFGTQQEAFDTKFRSDALIALLQDPNNTTMSKSKLRDALVVSQGLDPEDFRKTPDEIEQEQQAQLQAQQMAQQGVQAPQPVV